MLKLTDVRNLKPPTPDPPLYRQALVGLLVGGAIGPLVGWFVGTLATFLAVAVVANYPNGVATRGMRLTAFTGGLIGILLGLVVGLLVSVPLRIAAAAPLKSLKDARVGAIAGAALGLGCGLLVQQFWHPSPEAFVYTMLHSVVVGGAVGAVTMKAEPRWL